MTQSDANQVTQVTQGKRIITSLSFDAFFVDAVFADGTVSGGRAVGVGRRQLIRVGLLRDRDLSIATFMGVGFLPLM